MKDELIEQLADAEHASWARWMAHLFTKGEHHGDGSFTLPGGYVKALQRQVETPYSDLTEQEKEYDREEVQHILPFIDAYAAASAASLVAERPT